MAERKILCVNIMVKNESKIINRCLQSSLFVAKEYVIHDTGSTDDTVRRIREFGAKHNVPVTVREKTEFKNFEYNRNLALRDAAVTGTAEWVLLMDADMEFRVGPEFKKQFLTTLRAIKPNVGVVRMIQKNSSIQYFNARLVRRSLVQPKNIRYIGATHEYLCSGGTGMSELPLTCCYLLDLGDGGCKHDKFERDERLLRASLEKDPGNPRTLFYLAQTYKDQGKFEIALQTYREYRKVSNWDEESWFALYMISHCLLKLGREAEAVMTGFEALQLRPSRAECMYNLMRWARVESKQQLGWALGMTVAGLPLSKDALFVEHGVYDHLVLFELTILAYYVKKFDVARRLSNFLLLGQTAASGHVLQQVQRNMEFYCAKFQTARHRRLLHPTNGYNCMNPSVARHDGAVVVNLRAVNYLVDRHLHYSLNPALIGTGLNLETPVHTRNFLGTFEDGRYSFQREIRVNEDLKQPLPEHRGVCMGTEDLRLVSFEKKLWFIGTSQAFTPDHVNRMVLGDADCTVLHLLKSPMPGRCEKNWLPFVYQDKLCVIYSFDPFTVLQLDTGSGAWTPLVEDKKWNEQLATHGFRGSAAPVAHPTRKGEYLTVVHEVYPHHSARRLYTHRVLHLGLALELKGLSMPLNMKGNEPVEYVSGLLTDKDHCTFFWGEMDRFAFATRVDTAELLAAIMPPEAHRTRPVIHEVQTPHAAHFDASV